MSQHRDISRKSTLVIACGAIAHELITVLKANKLDNIQVQCLPAEWHNTPERITPAVEHKIRDALDTYETIFVAYGDCGTGGQLDKVLKRYGIERLPGDHCYSFFAGQEVFDALSEEALGTFYLTDYLVDNFQRLILDGLGISKHPELLDMYFAHYTRVVFLAQGGTDAVVQRRQLAARQAAASLGLPLLIHETGLQPFEHSLRAIPIASI